MKKLLLIPFAVITALLCVLTSCSDSDDPAVYASNNDTSKMTDVNKWMYEYMCANYLWNEPIPKLTLSPKADYDKFFNSILTGIDALDHMNRDDGHWENGQRENFYSYIKRTEDNSSRALVDPITGSGVLYMGLAAFSNSSYAIIPAQVAPGSPADKAGIKRGSIITKINNQTLTQSNINEYADKLYDGGVSVTFGDAIFDNSGRFTGIINQSTETIPAETFDDPAIYLSKIITLANGKKVGYICYMHFDYGADDQLIDIFSQFKNQGVSELVLDLRYNGGGHVLASTVMGSLIAGNIHKGKVYNHTTYNASRSVKGEDGFYRFGTAATPEGNYPQIATAVNASLDLNRIFVLCTVRTASASELVINGLRGVDVTVNLIGETTNGKNVGMESVKKTFGSYEYELTPITFYSQNAKNFRDFANGFTPDVAINESEYIYSDFGDKDELLLGYALQWINSGNMPSVSISRSGLDRQLKYLPVSEKHEWKQPRYQNAIAIPGLFD